MGGDGGRAGSPSITIEKMTAEDLPAVLAIENVSFPTPFTENLFRMELDLDVAHLYVARTSPAEKNIVGYVDFWRVGSEIHVITIAVVPSFRRRGIGSVLIDFVLDDARKNRIEQISLDVRPSNEAAIALYRRYGFAEIGRRKGYYQDNNEDALVLGLSLKQEK